MREEPTLQASDASHEHRPSRPSDHPAKSSPNDRRDSREDNRHARAARPAGAGQGRPRILLAEDDDEMRSMLVFSLEREGYQIIECRDGLQLLDRLRAPHFLPAVLDVDLTISDIRMPGMSGLEVLRRMRKAGVETPIILITAFGDEDTHREALDLGAMAVIDKPFEIEQLLKAVREIVPRPFFERHAFRLKPKVRIEKGVLQMEATFPSDRALVLLMADKTVQLVKEVGAAAGREYDVGVAVREALTAAVPQGKIGEGGQELFVRLRCNISGGVSLLVRCTGKGCGQTPDSTSGSCQERLSLIGQLMDEVHLDHRNGREIRMLMH